MIPETTFVRDPMYPQSFCVRDFSVYFGSPSGSIDADMQFLALLEYLEFPDSAADPEFSSALANIVGADVFSDQSYTGKLLDSVFPGKSLHLSLRIDDLEFRDKYVIHHLRRSSPIGCHDQRTVRWCTRNRIPHYFGSNPSILLRRTIDYDPEGEIFVVGVDPDLLPPFEHPLRLISEKLVPKQYSSVGERLKILRKRINCFQRARMVITNRVDLAMACLGMEIPLIMVESGSPSSQLTTLPGSVRVYADSSLKKIELDPSKHSYDVVRWKQMVGWRSRSRIVEPAKADGRGVSSGSVSVAAPKNEFWKLRPQIPARAHFIWLGGPLPRFVTGFIDRFRSLHPKWDVILHRSIPLDFPLHWQKKFLTLKSHAGRSDWIRIWLIHSQGGFYLDTDVWAFRCFDELRNYTCLGLGTGKGWSNNAFMAERAGGPAVEELIRRLEEQYLEKDNPMIIDPESGWKWSRYFNAGPALFTMAGLQRPDLFNLAPPHWFQCAYRTDRRIELVRASDGELPALLERRIDMPDGVHPFGLHCGSDVERLVFPDASAGSSKCLNPATAILKRLYQKGNQIGVVIGDPSGVFSAELLVYAPRLFLRVVAGEVCLGPNEEHLMTSEIGNTFRKERRTIVRLREATEFAETRVTILNGADTSVQKAVGGERVDFVFFYLGCGNVTAGTLDIWLGKLKPGGFLGGVGYDNSSRPELKKHIKNFANRASFRITCDEGNTWFVRTSCG